MHFGTEAHASTTTMTLSGGQGKTVWMNGVWSDKNLNVSVLDNDWPIPKWDMYMNPNPPKRVANNDSSRKVQLHTKKITGKMST